MSGGDIWGLFAGSTENKGAISALSAEVLGPWFRDRFEVGHIGQP